MSIASLDVAPNSVVPNDTSRDFDPVVAFGGKFPVAFVRQWEREMSTSRPYVTKPLIHFYIYKYTEL